MGLLVVGAAMLAWLGYRSLEVHGQEQRKSKGKTDGKTDGIGAVNGSAPEFYEGQAVCRLATFEWGCVRRCQRGGGGWHYEVDFTDSAVTMSGEELVS